MKTCATCGESKERNAFGSWKANRVDGLRDSCRVCNRRAGRESKSDIEEPANVFEWVEKYGDEENFNPRPVQKPTSHPPGTEGKVEELRQRVLRGETLWHDDDVLHFVDYDQSKARRNPEKKKRNTYTRQVWRIKKGNGVMRFEEVEQ